MAGPITIAVLANGTQAKGEFRSISTSAAGMGRDVSRVSGFLKTAAVAGFTAAGYAAFRYGKAATTAASDSEQSFGASQTVFARYADQIIKNSRRAGNAVGLSANDYRESANLIGSLLKNQGVDTDKLAGKTDRLVRMGADLAATFGGTTADAVAALGSAFKGEFDPLEQYGISIKQSQINTEALSVANVKSITEFNKLSAARQSAAKQQATNNLLLKQSADAAGTFRREAGTLAGQQQRLDAATENLSAKFGKLLIPYMIDAARYGRTEVVPFLSDLIRDFKRGDGGIGGFASGLVDQLGPALSTVGDALRDAGPELETASRELPSLGDVAKVAGVGIEFFADHADELAKAMPLIVGAFVAYKAAQAGANAAMTISPALKLADIAATRSLASATRELAAAQQSSATQARAVNTNTAAAATNTATAATNTSKFGLAARGAAGAAGLGALAAGAATSDDNVGTLLNTLGGAATGFAVGGPIGGAIGGLAGLVSGLANRTDKSTDATEASTSAWKSYAGALDQASGAITQATRDQAYQTLQEAEAFQAAETLGLSRKTLLNAALGQANASKRVSGALKAEKLALIGLAAERVSLVTGGGTQEQIEAIDEEIDKRREAADTIRAQIKAGRQSRAETQKMIKATRDIPRQVTTRIQQDGVPKTLGQFRDLIKGIRLTPKNVRTLVETTGIDLSRKQIRAVIDDLDKTGKTKTNPKVTADTASAMADAGAFIGRLKEIRSKTITITTRYRNIGSPGGGGGGGGGNGNGREVDPNGRLSIESEARSTAQQIQHIINRLNEQFEKEKKKLKESAKNHKEYLKGLRELQREYTQSLKGEITKAGDAYDALVKKSQAYAASVRDTFTQFGSLATLGQEEGYGNFDQMLDRLEGQVDQAKQFRDIVRELKKEGLNRATIKELLAQGPAALGAAQTLLSGGAAGIKDYNQLQHQLAGMGQSLGDQFADQFYGAGIKAAKALLAGLKKYLKKGPNGGGNGDREAGRQAARDYLDGWNSEHSRARRTRPANLYASRTARDDTGPIEIKPIRLTVEQLSDAERGREINVALTAYRRAGGR